MTNLDIQFDIFITKLSDLPAYIDKAGVTINIITMYFLRFHTDFQIGKLELLFAVYALILRKISDKNIRKIKYGKKR